MKKIVILAMLSILISCATTIQHVDVAIEDAAWSTLEVLENVSDKTLAVYYFTTTDEEDADLSEYVRRGLTTELANAIQYEELDIKVISRQQLDQIMAEQSFQLSDLVDEDTQVEIGELLGADLILSGHIDWVSEDMFHLNAQIVEVETGVIIGGYAYDFWVDME